MAQWVLWILNIIIDTQQMCAGLYKCVLESISKNRFFQPSRTNTFINALPKKQEDKTHLNFRAELNWPFPNLGTELKQLPTADNFGRHKARQ